MAHHGPAAAAHSACARRRRAHRELIAASAALATLIGWYRDNPAAMQQTLDELGGDLTRREPLQNLSGRTPLHHAAQVATEAVLRVVLAHEQLRPLVAAPDINGMVAVHFAVMDGCPLKTRALLAVSSTDADAVANDGSTVVSICARSLLHWRSLDVLEVLLSHVRDISQPMIDGRTCVHLAAAAGNVAVLGRLLDHNASLINARATYGDGGETPLHDAVRMGRPRCVQLLLVRGATVHVADRFGITPLHLALLCEDEPIVAQLLPFYGYGNINALIDNEVLPPNSPLLRRGRPHTMLEVAVLRGHVGVAKRLIVLGAERAGISPGSWRLSEYQLRHEPFQREVEAGFELSASLPLLLDAARSLDRRLPELCHAIDALSDTINDLVARQQRETEAELGDIIRAHCAALHQIFPAATYRHAIELRQRLLLNDIGEARASLCDAIERLEDQREQLLRYFHEAVEALRNVREVDGRDHELVMLVLHLVDRQLSTRLPMCPAVTSVRGRTLAELLASHADAIERLNWTREAVLVDGRACFFFPWQALDYGSEHMRTLHTRQIGTTNMPGNVADQLHWPSGIALDADGRVVVANFGNSNVVIVAHDAEPVESRVLRTTAPPSDVCVTRHGDLLVSLVDAGQLQVLSGVTGAVLWTHELPAGSEIGGLVLLPDGSAVVSLQHPPLVAASADSGVKPAADTPPKIMRLRVRPAPGQAVVMWTLRDDFNRVGRATGLAYVRERNEVVVCDPLFNCLHAVDADDGTALRSLCQAHSSSETGEAITQLSYPLSVAHDPVAQRLLVGELKRLSVWTLQGRFVCDLARDSVQRVEGLAVSYASRTLFVSDRGRHRVARLSDLP